MIDLDKIEADAREATLYQWESGTDEQGALVLAVPRRGEGFTVAEVHSGYEDARHIANMSPAATLELVARLRRAEATIDRAQRHMAKLNDELEDTGHDETTELGHIAACLSDALWPSEQRIANPQAVEGDTGR